MAKRRTDGRLAAATAALLLVPLAAAAGPVAGLGARGDALAEMDNVQRLAPAEKGRPSRLVLGDNSGFVHVYEDHDGRCTEVWVSRYLEGSIGSVVVADVNGDSLDEIVVCTDRGRLHYLDTRTYNTMWSNAPGEYQQITAVLAANVDDDPQLELLLGADGRLVVFDGRDQFEEWRSEQTGLTTSAILVADVDSDGVDEIVLNDGYVFDARGRTLEWQYAEGFGERMGALDLDADGTLELIGEYRGRLLRIFDIDLRREKSLRPNF